MKFLTKYALIIFVVFRAAYEVQAISPKSRRVKRQPETVTGNTNQLDSNFVDNPALRRELATENVLISTQATIKNPSTAVNSFQAGIPQTEKENVTLRPPLLARKLPSQRIYCRQIIKTEMTNEGKLLDSIQHICAPLQTTTTKPPASTTWPFAGRENSFRRRLSTTTPKGINCRRVMNSELNDLGEIIDSVTEVCDPPTTTTTTTKRPAIVFTRPTTTTLKPLVKICRPVMDSYLNEAGQIIDSVTMYCKMTQVD